MKSLFALLITLFIHSTYEISLQKTLPKVVIVGGGPAGYSSALALQLLGWENITVLEKRPSAQVFDTLKSYTYFVDGRGQKILREIGVSDEVCQKGFSFENTKGYLTSVQVDGSIKRTDLPFKPDQQLNTSERIIIPRYALLDTLLAKIKKVNKQTRSALSPCIDVKFNAACSNIHYDSSTGKLQVSYHCAEEDDDETKAAATTTTIEADLLLGCDGLNSIVRTWLYSGPEALLHSNLLSSSSSASAESSFSSVSSSEIAKQNFGLSRVKVDSAGLLYKFLSVKPGMKSIPLRKTNSNNKKKALMTAGQDKQGEDVVEELAFDDEKFYAIRGKNYGWLKPQPSLSFLPVKNGTLYRTVNIIRQPDDPIWSLSSSSTTTNAMRDYLQSTFPQIAIEDFIDDDSIAAFAATKAGSFPMPQHVNGMQAVFYSLANSSSSSSSSTLGEVSLLQQRQPTAAIALLGDCAHAFPPDLAQGVNAALEDVRSLYASLQKHPDNIVQALESYEQYSLPEAKAIVNLLPIGFPYQYKQMVVKRFFFLIGVGIRMVMSNVFPWFIAKPTFFLVQRESQLSYSEIWKKTKQTRRRLFVVTTLALAASAAAIIKNGQWISQCINKLALSPLFALLKR